MFILENQRKQFQSFKDVDHLNQSIRVYLYKYKKEFHNHNTDYKELNSLGKVFKTIYTHSVAAAYGVSFLSNKTIARLSGVSIRSAKRATKRLSELDVILKLATKRQNKSDTSNTIVIKPLLSSVVDKVAGKGKTPCHPPLSPLESESFNHLKQDFIKDIDIESDERIKEISNYVALKLHDTEKRTGKIITYLSSYVEQVMKELKQKALLWESKRQQKEREKRQNAQNEALQELLELKQENVQIPFYNWLEEE